MTPKPKPSAIPNEDGDLTPPDKVRFSRYSNHRTYAADITAEHLSADSNCHARAESSGSEGTYCEVAKFNETSNRLERYAFYKFWSRQDAEEAADYINFEKWPPTLYHTLPTWGSEEG
jgi:hypothetical protein